MKRTTLQACVTASAAFGRQQSAGKKVSPLHHGVNSRSFIEIYNRYYRDPVEALYRAVKEAK